VEVRLRVLTWVKGTRMFKPDPATALQQEQ